MKSVQLEEEDPENKNGSNFRDLSQSPDIITRNALELEVHKIIH